MPSEAVYGPELLTVKEMYDADRATVTAGTSGLALMEAAGAAITREIRTRWRPRPTLILCGPGNNGGDGIVVARLLQMLGWPVRLALLGSPTSLKGDAAVNAQRWAECPHGPGTPVIRALDPALLDPAAPEGGAFAANPLIVDALFGAGLARALDGLAADMVAALAGRDVVAVDIPSGVSGDDGAILGTAPHCQLTVTFFRGKPGHYLAPGRDRCGHVVVADIGIPTSVLSGIAPSLAVNDPVVWRHLFPRPSPMTHKYMRGHAVIDGGPMTGAARLAAAATRRIGAGLVTILAPSDLASIYAADQPGTIVLAHGDGARSHADNIASILADPRHNAVLIGPGAGATNDTRASALAALAAGRACVIDADALTAFQSQPQALFERLNERSLLTPHDGEFARLFGGGNVVRDASRTGCRLDRALAAAARCGAVVLLKGSDTVIAAPDGRALINADAPPDLATAGSGDVLAGMSLGLIAQGMPTFEAAAAAAWCHSEAARRCGGGLIAEDLITALPAIVSSLRA